MTNITIYGINSRETYLAFRAAWKAEYKLLSVEIRELKLRIKRHMRNSIPSGSEQNALRSASAKATDMLINLAEAKDLAREHEKQKTEAAA